MGSWLSPPNDSLESARSKALLLLRFAPRSESELRLRLLRTGFSGGTVDLLLEEFKKKDLVNDAQFARYASQSTMASKPVSRRALIAKLKSKGIDPSLAAQAVQEATQDSSDLEQARRLAVKRVSRYSRLPVDAARRRLVGFLGRRGFSSEVAGRVAREVTEGWKESPLPEGRNP